MILKCQLDVKNIVNAFVPCFGYQDIMVGPQYQAIIPSLCTHTFYERGECLLLSGVPLHWLQRFCITNLLSPLGSTPVLLLLSPAYENDDQLLWTPDVLSSLSVETFLLEVQRKGSGDGPTNTLTTGDVVKDNEQVGLNHADAALVFSYNLQVAELEGKTC